MKLGLVGNIHKPRIREIVQHFVALLNDYHVPVIYEQELARHLGIAADASLPIQEIGSNCTIVVAFGGDGTILATAQKVGQSGVPILGVNLGGLGFLAEVMIDELQSSVDDLVHKRFSVIERMVLNVAIHKDTGSLSCFALNDVVVDKGAIPRLKYIIVMVDGTLLNTYRADGIIVATPTGSTAYSLSAGGPLMMPTMNAMIVTPICPHSLTVRPIALADQSTLEIFIQPGQDPANVSIDGQSRTLLLEKERIFISKADFAVKWVSIGKRDFFEILRTKLNWGVQPLILNRKE